MAAAHCLIVPHCGIGRGLQRSFCRVGSRSLFKKRCASLPISRLGWSTRKVGYICGRTQKRTLSGGGIRSGSRRGNNEIGVHPSCQRRRIRDGALGEIGDLERQPTMLCQVYLILDAAPNGSRWDLFGTLRPRRLTRRQLDTSRSLTSLRLRRRGRPARSCRESASGTHCRGDDETSRTSTMPTTTTIC